MTKDNIFKNKQSKDVIKYIKEKYKDDLEFLWMKFPNNAIWRRSDNKKWYAALLLVKKKKIGIQQDGEIEIIDLRATPEFVAFLVDNKKVFPGYHMNKKHWITICLNNSIPIKTIFNLIDESYLLAKK